MEARRYRMLGGLDVLDGGAALDLGTRKQRAVLAVLLLAEGRVVTADGIVGAVWGDAPPDRAEASLQSYVSTLRRILEPDRPPRAPATVLVTRGPGYALLVDRDAVDARRFVDLAETGRARHAAGDLPGAATALRNALATYAPLLPEFEGEAFRDAAARHLEGVHEAALELSYEVRMALGEHPLLVADLQAAVQRHPLNEGLWALLALARYRLGRQGDALRALADCRRVLADELGVDPGPRIRQLEADVLAQAPHLDPPPATAALPPVEQEPAQRTEQPTQPRRQPPHHLVGRTDETALLARVLADSAAGGHGLVVVEGEPGAGKTRLLEEAARLAAGTGALTLWGRCLEGAGAPTMWPWIQAVGDLLDTLDEETRRRWLAGELGALLHPVEGGGPAVALPDAGAQFRMFEQAARVVESVAADRPVLLVVDDLQWADTTSLQLFEHLAARLPARTTMVGALRDRAPTPSADLSRTLAAASRLPGHRRIRLGPLGAAEVGELVRQETGRDPGGGVAARIHSRTGGNPFFVRELARLLDDSGGLDDVPSGVRDVVRGRMAGLEDRAKRLLQIAALIGRDVDLGLLARAAGLDIEVCLELLEPVEALGLLAPNPDDPFSFRFAHDLVRESVAETTPPLLATRLHLKVADALEATAPGGDAVAERLAHHLWSAGPLAAPDRTAAALVAAGRRAMAKYAYTAAERHLQNAVQVARGAGAAEPELDALSLLIAVTGMRVGYVGATLEPLERAEELARQLGLDRSAADFLYSRWAAYSQGIQLDRSGPLAARLLAEGEDSADPVLRMYGVHAWGVHQWDIGEIGESYRYLSRAIREERSLAATADGPRLRYDLSLLTPAFHAFMTTLHGDPEGGFALFEEWAAGLPEDPYPLMVWGAFYATSAAMAGDAARAARVAARAIAVDPQFTFEFLGTYTRACHLWGTALSGTADPSAAADGIGRLVDGMPTDPPRSGLATWLTVQAETLLVAGRVDDAATVLGRAQNAVERYGQRYCEGFLRLLQARRLHAAGVDDAAVRAAVARARALSEQREAFLFVRRCDEFLATLD